MNGLVEEAQRAALQSFKNSATALALKCGAEWSKTVNGHLFVNHLFGTPYLSIEVAVDILGEPFQVRFSLGGPEQLQVGWGSNYLLTTNLDHYNDYQIQGLFFIAEVFRHEDEWRAALTALDLEPILRAEQREKEMREAVEKAAYEEAMDAYNRAGVMVGSVFVDVTHSMFHYQVTNIFGDKIKFGRGSMKKVDVGRKLLNNEWLLEP